MLVLIRVPILRTGPVRHVNKLPAMAESPAHNVYGTARGPIARLGNDGFIAATASTAQPAGDYQIVETASARGLKRVFDVKHVRGEVSKSDTGTTFLLADDGLYVVRQPEVESDKKLREQQWLDNHGAE